MKRAEDFFWDVKARENLEEESYRRAIAELHAQLDLARRVESLRHQAGFKEFLESVTTIHKVARERLVGDDQLTDAGLREQRGKVRGLESVLALLTKPTIAETLAFRIQSLQNQMNEAIKRRPQPKTEVTNE